MKNIQRTLLVLLSTAALHACAAAWTPADLDTLTGDFTAGMSKSYSATLYPWQFLNCTDSKPDCFGTNPDSPYGAPNFGPNGTSSSAATTHLKTTDALVLIMETPPAMRYFGVTSYLFTRYYPNHIPPNPATPGFVPVFESLNDTVNLDVIGTTGSPQAGASPFTQLSVLVFTADSVTQQDIVKELGALGFPNSAVNLVNLPINAVPLNMGTAPTSDTYSMLLRMAYPNDPAQMQDYINRAPLRVVYLSALQARRVSPVSAPSYRVPGSSPAESADLTQARDALVLQLRARFGTDYAISELPVPQLQTDNYVCISKALPCNGDNSDAIYSKDVHAFVPTSPQDRILVVGVNHVSQGKATYLSHSLVADANHMGVLGVSDTWLTGTGLTMGGVSGPSDPRYATYSQLYAFTMSYDCQSDATCITIPQPSSSQPEGIPYGNAIDVTGRVYLDPQTKTRPSTHDIINHRVFILHRKQGVSQ
jgi:hypothetical protein